MEEQRFLRTMLETVKHRKYEKKDELIGILRNSIITYDRTGTFGSKGGYYREYIDLRVPIPMLEIAEELQSVLGVLASDVYIEPDTHTNYEFWALRIKPKPVELDTDEYVEHDVVFDEIKEKIIQGIRGAKYTIWIAVAWFTNREIFNELLLRKRDGVNVRIITSDESNNQALLPELDRNFELVKVPKKGYNRLHNKFCIIDLEYVMHGSYNWSKTAPNNNETWATALDRDFVRKFADEFIELFVNN
ncbi:phospholipase D-like domain-containing protein [Cytobacillus oceanisediminis]|uniref:phospholipase D-like domain-containing protein n=1 Tax=Cytobacillus oceanisediminis TaxID=665099 RepID=UPI0023DB16EA|nr:phospholipase D-like domain-containing protein [Cytobacillus oceanisediminis]MDF2036571.1 phospholipase D-like domain-containing protein [Cytobacillus oceanisediminis]